MKAILLIFLLFFQNAAFCAICAQADDPPADTANAFKFKPVIGLGTGMFTFYGDISSTHKATQPLVSRTAYELMVSQEISSSILLSFYVFTGKLGANERSLSRNLNFESEITTGGLDLTYNFNNFLKPNHIVEPYLTLGFESCEFLSKTDLVDASGNTYYYWKDGSIRNIDENDPDAENAIRLIRDYTYESDIRELNLDGFGKYPERSWAIPAGIGLNLHLNKRWTFRMGTAMHFTLTDYIDGITNKSKGNRAGDASNDRFLMSSFSLHYHFFTAEKKTKGGDTAPFENIDFTALQSEDSDRDGISDFDDHCPDTPDNVEVDENGCPLDEDGDGVPDYIDLEQNTPDSVLVDGLGRTMQDSTIREQYLRYMDSTGVFAQITHKTDANESKRKKTSHKYFIRMGTYSEEIAPSVADFYLSLPDVQTIEEGQTTYFVMPDKSISPLNTDSHKNTIEKEQQPSGTGQAKNHQNEIKDERPASMQADLIYRVQIGAYTRKLPENIFSGLSGILEVPSNDGITRYYSKSFTELDEATKYKYEMEMKGFNGAFVVPFKNGQRIPFSETGNTQTPTSGKQSQKKDTQHADAYGKVRFKVQVASCTTRVKPSVLSSFKQFGQLSTKQVNGSIKYLIGSFPDYNTAQQLREKINNGGIKDAFVVGEYNGKLLPASEAIKMLK